MKVNIWQQMVFNLPDVLTIYDKKEKKRKLIYQNTD